MQFLVNGLIAGSVYALVGLSFALIFRAARFFHIAHGAVFAWGAYFCYACHVLLKLPLALSSALALGLSAGLGVALEILVYRRMRRRATGLVLLVASLGLYVALQNVISVAFGDRTRSLRPGAVPEAILLLGGRVTSVQILTVVVSLLSVISVALLLRMTRVGRAIRAVANDPELARISGIHSDRVILYAFAIGSGLAGAAGVLVALDVGMTPTMGMNALLLGVVAVIIGGTGSVPGAALGGLLLGMVQNLSAWKIGSQWQDAIAFLILLAFLLIRPQGFLGGTLKRSQA